MTPKINRTDLQRAVASLCLSGFIRWSMPGYQMGWVHEEICAELDDFLEAVQRRESPRLMITMPPRHGKSEIATRRFPAYCLGRHPDTSIISTSYSADLASMMNRDVQRIMDDERYAAVFPGVSLGGKNIQNSSTKSYLRNSDIFEIVGHNGVYRSAGVGGGITGMGGDIIIIDDPYKNREQADSPTMRNKIWDWYTSTLYTRLSPGGGIILIQTRWHTDDLAGRLMRSQTEEDGETWRIVNYEAIASQDEPHRKAGEALHPERYSLKQLDTIRKTLGTREWLALYQQKPVPDGGAIFERQWIRYWTPDMLPTKWDRVVMSWDLTFKDSDGSDYVVGQVWGLKGGEAYLLDQVRDRLSFTGTMRAVVAMVNKWPQASEKYIEDKANGPAVIDAIKKHVSGVIPVEPDGSKIARAYATTPFFEAGNVYIPQKGMYTWVSGLLDELMQFPAGAHDDQVDAMTQALRKLLVTHRKQIIIGDNFFGAAKDET